MSRAWFTLGFAVGILCLWVGLAQSAEEAGNLVAGKVIAFGGGGPVGDVPDVEMFHHQIREMESALPVDGIVLSVNLNINGENVYLPDAWWSKRALKLEDFEKQIDNLNDTGKKRFTDNFLLLNVGSGDVDWFDDSGWSVIIENAQIAATVAKEGGLKGIFLDTEQYKPEVRPFDYSRQSQRDLHSFQDYTKQAFEQGEHLAEAFESGFPGMLLILTRATSSVAEETGLGTEGELPLINSSANLLPAFVDGLLAGGRSVEVMDAFKGAYLSKTWEEFVTKKRFIKEKAARLSTDPQTYDFLLVGFGIWPTADEEPNNFNREDIFQNYFTPAELEHALSYALEQSDGYIWIYLGGMPAFTGQTFPESYLKAIARAKKPHAHFWQAPARPPLPETPQE